MYEGLMIFDCETTILLSSAEAGKQTQSMSSHAQTESSMRLNLYVDRTALSYQQWPTSQNGGQPNQLVIVG